jgi:cytochrome c oxidase assembly factor CtaG
MDPTFSAVLRSWDWRLDVIFVLLFMGAMYTRGWFVLRKKGAQIANRWRLVSYLAGLAFLAIALMSAIDVFQDLLFFVHMIQHLFLVMIAPPLLLLANPMPVFMWALPRGLRLWVGQFFKRGAYPRSVLKDISSPMVIWLAYTVTLWLWHDPSAYVAAIENDFLHDIEHLSFFITGMLLWWYITNAAPKLHGKRPPMLRIGLASITYFQNLFLGMGLALWGSLIYDHYANVPRVWGIDPVRDQSIGGLIMWIPGGMMYGIAILVLINDVISEAERKARVEDRKRELRRLSSSEA